MHTRQAAGQIGPEVFPAGSSRAGGWHISAAVRALLWWMASVPADRMIEHEAETQMRYSAMGFVVTVWFAFMLVIWGKVGYRYWGITGALSCLLLPTLMLALDRMLLGMTRNPGDELSDFRIDELGADGRGRYARALLALSFSAVSTLSFMLDLSQSDIQAHHVRQQELANAPLRQSLLDARKSEHDARDSAASAARAIALAQLQQLQGELETARSAAATAEEGARRARREALTEQGALDGRQGGEGKRYHAYSDMEKADLATARRTRTREADLTRQTTALERRISELDASSLQARLAFNAQVAAVDQVVMNHPGYVRRLSGVFADTTAFLSLLVEPGGGAGRVLWSVLLATLMMALELSPLLAAHFLQTTVYDVERIARSRVDAARRVASAEIEIAKAWSRLEPVAYQAAHIPHGKAKR